MSRLSLGIQGAHSAARRGLASLAAGALYLLGLSMILVLIAAWLDNPMQEAVLGALAVSLVASRAGLAEAGAPSSPWSFALGAATLASLPLVGAAIVILFRAGVMPQLAGPKLSLLFGSMEAFALAYRDELWLHGMPLLFARRAGISVKWAVLFAALAGVAAVAHQPGASIAGLALTFFSGGYFALLWKETRNARVPVSAYFGWLFLSGSVLSGEVLQLPQPLPYGASSSGVTTWVATVLFALLAGLQYRGWPRWTPAAPTRDR